MNAPNRLLIVASLGLIAFTMAFGTWYAIFDEHQTLVGMGTLLATGFVEAAGGDMEAAFRALDDYAALSREYRLEVHSHGHWGMLALVLLVLGLSFDQVAYSEPRRRALAWLLVAGSVLFPLGVLMQIGPAAGIGQALSVLGSVAVLLGLLVAAWGLARKVE
jgi:hypothetical protein